MRANVVENICCPLKERTPDRVSVSGSDRNGSRNLLFAIPRSPRWLHHSPSFYLLHPYLPRSPPIFFYTRCIFRFLPSPTPHPPRLLSTLSQPFFPRFLPLLSARLSFLSTFLTPFLSASPPYFLLPRPDCLFFLPPFLPAALSCSGSKPDLVAACYGK